MSSPTHISTPLFPTGTPALLRTEMEDTPPIQSSIEEDLRSMLRALPTRADLETLPTRADIEALILRIEEAHNKAIQEVREDLHTVENRVTSGENRISTLEERMQAMEQSHQAHSLEAQEMQLHLEEMEDRSRRNNLRLRGIPEATGQEDLAATATAIFQSLLDNPPPHLEIDRVHRTLGPKSTDPARPRDVLCRLHRYAQKEILLRRAWDQGEVEFDGAHIQILPDLSRATLQRRAMLKPVLELARSLGCTYRWGYPLAVIFRTDRASFTLRTPADLPALFDFLGTEPIQMPNWLLKIPRPTGRMGPTMIRPNPSIRSQRPRGRSRARPGNNARES